MEKQQSQVWRMINTSQLKAIISSPAGLDKHLIIDSRSFLEYNTCHVAHSVNVCCSKLVKKRLQQDKVTITDLLAQACHADLDPNLDIIVYDQCTENPSALSADCFLMVLVSKLTVAFNSVSLVKGGFLEFQAMYPSLTETKSMRSQPGLTSMSQPCMPVSNVGPTRVLPFLYLGSQQDALSKEQTQKNGINYILNVSTVCPQPNFISEGHFLRIPVNDNYSDKLIPHFHQAFQFINKVREANGCVLVHCLAGISRSPTLAIAYIMQHLNMSSEDAYRYVKDKRATISPNFNFLGQLLEYEKQMKQAQVEKREASVSPDSPTKCIFKRQCVSDRPEPPGGATLPGKARTSSKLMFPPALDTSLGAQSPTTALAKLNFNQPAMPETLLTNTATNTAAPLAAPTAAPSATTTTTTTSTTTTSTTKDSQDLQIHSFPTTSLDQLSFTPCFVKEDSSTKAKVPVRRPVCIAISESSKPRALSDSKQSEGAMSSSSSLSSLAGPMKSTATKRPRSVCVAETKSRTDANKSNSTGGSGDASSAMQSQVTLRSPEMRAKRPLVRPNSIAFSTYPKFDFTMDNNTEQASTNAKNCQSSSSASSSRLRAVDWNLNTTTIGTTNQSVSKNYPGFMDRLQGGPCYQNIESSMRKQNMMDQGRKSRSLEDILNSPDDDVGHHRNCNCTGLGRVLRSRGAAVNDFFSAGGGGVTLEQMQCHCRVESDPHQSSSSISSSGSHNSLHGSLEIIQVS